MNITNKSFRELCISLLDSEDGIKHDAYCKLEDMAVDGGFDARDIFDAVDAANGKVFLNEEIAAELSKK